MFLIRGWLVLMVNICCFGKVIVCCCIMVVIFWRCCMVFGRSIMVGGVDWGLLDFNDWVLMLMLGLLRVFLKIFLICLLWDLLVVGFIMLLVLFFLIKF